MVEPERAEVGARLPREGGGELRRRRWSGGRSGRGLRAAAACEGATRRESWGGWEVRRKEEVVEDAVRGGRGWRAAAPHVGDEARD